MDFIDYANRIGIPWAIILVSLAMLWKGLKVVFAFLAVKLFSEEHDGRGKPRGLVNRFVLEQIEVMEVVKQSAIDQEQSLKLLIEGQKKISGQIHCPKEPPNVTG